MRTLILPYRAGSGSARALARHMGVRRIKLAAPRPFSARGKRIINWGASQWPPRILHIDEARIINNPVCVKQAANKLSSFMIMSGHGVSTPDWTTNRDEAADWLRAGNRVVVRQLLTAHSGRGIQVVTCVDDLEDAPLYSMYVKKIAEYRVHVVGGTIIDFAQKKRGPDWNGNNEVRNHSNGWVFAREDVELPPPVAAEALKAVAAFFLDFGAVDVLWNANRQTAYVCEVNTAPGLEGTTLDRYAEALSNEHL